MTLHIDLSPEMEGFIETKVAAGSYGNASEVIRDAIGRMQDDDRRLAVWRAAVREGTDELDRGEGVEYTRESLADITRDARSVVHSGTPIDPDVLP